MHLPSGSCSAIGLRLTALLGGFVGLGRGLSQQSVQRLGNVNGPGSR